MANVKLLWELPDTRISGGPLVVDDIARVDIELSADGVNFASIGSFPPSVLETTVEALDTGEWQFRGVVVDKKGKASDPMFATVVVDESAPGPLKTLIAVLQ